MKNKKITIDLSVSSIDDAIQQIENISRSLEEKTNDLSKRLAEIGLNVAKITFSSAQYDGDNDVSVKIEQRDDETYAVVATGASVLFIEFGSGVMMGQSEYGTQYGMGAGTYPIPPGKGHWNDPNGWYLPKDVQSLTGKKKSFGNPPAGAMYAAVKEIEIECERIVREVFAVD